MPQKGHNEVGIALEAAGTSVIGVSGAAAQEPQSTSQAVTESQPTTISQPAAEPTIAGHLRELADLHCEGILSDDEFASAKAKMLGGL